MGIINCTPDSFSDGGAYPSAQAAVDAAKTQWECGVALVDIGGESSRPGSARIAIDEERRRVLPVLEILQQQAPEIPVSVDTSRATLMAEALTRGAVMINDIRAFEGEGALQCVAAHPDALLCMMHTPAEPQTMMAHATYTNVVDTVSAYLHTRVQAAGNVGISRTRIVVDPGFGFGKDVDDNLRLLHHLPTCEQAAGCPVLAGLSRKRTLGVLSGEAKPKRRLGASLAAAIAAATNGASIVRVHDAKETVDALRFWARWQA